MTLITVAVPMAAIGAGAQMYAANKASKSQSVSRVSTMNHDQLALFNVGISRITGIPTSVISGNKLNLLRLAQSGELDHLSDPDAFNSGVSKKVFQPDRVANLTSTQKDILQKAVGTNRSGLDVRKIFESGDLQSKPMTESQELPVPEFKDQSTSDFDGNTSQTVGEGGAEVITPTEDVRVIPNGGVEGDGSLLDTMKGQTISNPILGTAPVTAPELKGHRRLTSQKNKDQFNADTIAFNQNNDMLSNFQNSTQGGQNPLASESNTVGVSGEELISNTGLTGFETGGVVKAGQSAVVGEGGTETLVPTGVGADVQNATKSALSGQSSSTINRDTTNQFIKSNVVDPANRQFNRTTMPSISASTAGVGFLGSQKVKATQVATDNLSNQIGQQSSAIQFQDEQARRSLAESAANRQAGAIQTGLNVQNNDLLRGQSQANIAGTQARTAGTEASTLGTQANTLGTQANTLGTQANTESTGVQTDRLRGLIPIEVEQAMSNLNLSDTQIQDLKLSMEQQVSATGRFDLETEAMFKEGGVSDQQIEQMRANIASTSTATEGSAIGNIVNQQNAIQQQILDEFTNYNNALKFANIEQAQNQAEIDGARQKLAEINEQVRLAQAEFNALFSETTTAITG